jgi:hypothetical protein
MAQSGLIETLDARRTLRGIDYRFDPWCRHPALS